MVFSTRRGRNRESNFRKWSVGFNDAAAGVELVALDAVTNSRAGVVDRVGRAAAADTVNFDKAALANAGHCVEIQDFIFSAAGAADGKLWVVVVGFSAVGADSLD